MGKDIPKMDVSAVHDGGADLQKTSQDLWLHCEGVMPYQPPPTAPYLHAC